MFAFATPEWIWRTDWQTVFLYWERAQEELAIRDAIDKARWGIERSRPSAASTREELASFGKLGKVTRG